MKHFLAFWGKKERENTSEGEKKREKKIERVQNSRSLKEAFDLIITWVLRLRILTESKDLNNKTLLTDQEVDIFVEEQGNQRTEKKTNSDIINVIPRNCIAHPCCA